MGFHGSRTRAARAAITATIVGAFVVAGSSASADLSAVDFEAPTYTTGSPNGQDGWSKTGPFDVEIVDHGGVGPVGFGEQSLRISNAVASGSFGDQTFSKPVAEAAGETTAENGAFSSPPTHSTFYATWQFTSTLETFQDGLVVVASPDRGDGARMSWISMEDRADGLAVAFYDFQIGGGADCGSLANFVLTDVATGLARDQVHTIEVTMEFVEGPANDVVTVVVDGTATHTGTSWEDFFRECQPPGTRTVDSILFRTSVAAASTDGNGFFIDNLSIETPAPEPPVDEPDTGVGGEVVTAPAAIVLEPTFTG